MDNWSYKNQVCETRLFDHIDDKHTVYRGSLTMPKNATPDDHAKTRRNFLQILNRWKTEHAYIIEMRGLLHITDPLNAHWDLLAYGDAPMKALKATVADAWKRSGGKWKGWSLTECKHTELVATIKYQSKDTLNPDIARRYLPESQANMGMKFIWHTRPSKTSKGFWQGHSSESLWKDHLDERYGKDRTVNVGTAPILDNMFRLKMVDRLRALTPYADDYLRVFSWHDSGSSGGSSGDLDSVLAAALSRPFKTGLE